MLQEQKLLEVGTRCMGPDRTGLCNYWSLNLAEHHTPGKPVAYNQGQVPENCRLLKGMVACCFGLLGLPGMARPGLAPPADS